jgi:hypothetical protein
VKCVGCATQNDYRTRQRNNGACDRCGRAFAFEPREGSPITDVAFQNAITTVSEDGRLAWLERQLYYEVARRVRRGRLLHRLTRRARVSLDHETFAGLLKRWVSVHGAPRGRLERNAFAADVRAQERAHDATEYGFDRLVVCESDDIVDMLLANGFHGDHKCAVLSASGYPTWAYELLLPRLRETPPTSIVVLHDADVAGCRLAAEVRSSAQWFGGVEGVEVVDAGLRPADATRFRGVYLEGSPADVLADPVSVEEARWLAKHRLELEAARPRALIAVLAGIFIQGEGDSAEQRGDAGGWWTAGGWSLGGDDDVG